MTDIERAARDAGTPTMRAVHGAPCEAFTRGARAARAA